MRKDKLSSYQAKKEKLQKIRKILLNLKTTIAYTNEDTGHALQSIWEIVKDE